MLGFAGERFSHLSKKEKAKDVAAFLKQKADEEPNC